jgi:hypothetical protein
MQNTVDDPKATSSRGVQYAPGGVEGDLMEYICRENNRDVQHLIGQ